MGKIELGKLGEDRAVQLLTKKGYWIVDRNVRTPYGEIDIVVLKPGLSDDEYVFVEVKTRRQNPLWHPSEAISQEKREQIVNAARYYIQEVCQKNVNWRIDVIMVEFDASRRERITHYENALFE